MLRSKPLLLLLGLASFGATTLYQLHSRPNRESLPPTSPLSSPRELASLQAAAHDGTLIVSATPSPAIDVETLIALAESAPSMESRIAAIDALGDAPRNLAIPVLARIAESAPHRDERQAALGALRTQAVSHGDPDDSVRAALRHLVYDGNDEVVSEIAAGTLASIELHAKIATARVQDQ